MTLTAHKPSHQQSANDYVGSLTPGQGDRQATELAEVELIHAEAAKRADLTRIWAASSDIESLQWQLDRAHNELKDAVRAAFHNGVDISEIAPSADLDPNEVQALLQS